MLKLDIIQIMKKLIVIKIGGSIITKKEKNIPAVNQKVLNQLSSEVADLHKKGYKLIIIHGAGSFAHSIAKKYQLDNGIKNKKQVVGWSQIYQSMAILNQTVCTSLEKHNLPVVPLPPHTFVRLKNKQIDQFVTKLIESFLKNNLVPVLYGDIVLDSKLTAAILSGDLILSYLAQQLKAERAIFLTDVDGVFDKNPKTDPQAKLISSINSQNVNSVLKNLKPHNPNDVTGEMYGKVVSIKNNLRLIDVRIVNGTTAGNLIQVAQGSQIGTKLYFH